LVEPQLLVFSVGRVAGNVDSALVRIGRTPRIGVTVAHLLAAAQLLIGSHMIFHAGRRLADRFAAWYPIKTVKPPIDMPGLIVCPGPASLQRGEQVASMAQKSGAREPH
jgi:hypothetical protein